MPSHNIHISYLLKNVISGFVYILYTEKHITWNNIQCHSHNVYKKVSKICIWCYLWYHTHIHVIITTQCFYKWYLCRCKHIPNNRLWTMSPLLCTAMWMCTDGHYDDSKKRLAETLKISHKTTKHVYNTMCRQNIIK